ncbi:MAG: M14 family zinc carboxypeptidase [Candidatus Thermoplasmatota archaeon]
MTLKKILGFGIVLILLASSLAATGSSFEEFPLSANALIRIDTTNGEVLLPEEAEFIAASQGEWMDVIIPRYRLQELSDLQISYEILIPDMDAYHLEMRGSYHTLAQMETILQTIAATYPSITSLVSIGTTYEGRNIWCLEISDNPGVDEGEPGVLFMGLHHAREWPTVEICLHIANNLTSLYGSNTTITNLVNNRRIWIVTCVNPDGYYYCHDLGNDWRKNRKPYPGGIGVDLNRNYQGSSNGEIKGAWGSIGSGSVTHSASGETYCGPGPTSELEIIAISDFIMDHEICALITWHTYQEELYWPWGYTSSTAPDVTYMSAVGTGVAQRITRQSGSGTYTPKQAYGLYPTTGDTTDWAYGYSHYVLGRPTFAYTIEACSSFHPSASYLDQICKENCDGGMYLLQEAENIQNTVIPRVMPPILADLPIDPDGNYRVSWQEQNPSAQPDFFQLDELTGLSIGTDDAESGSGKWTCEGFALSTSRYHSGSQSFKSRYLNADTSAMTTISSIPIIADMKLSFWCWYSTENNYDVAFVEVSTDGRSYEVLDTFMGTSSNWQYKEYDLSTYVNQSIFIRFRYTTDSNTLQEGFYVDDISPVATFQTVTTLSNSITDTFYDITGKTNGTYYYRVKGHNSARGWCDFSTLESVLVALGEDTTPPVTTCTLTGEMEGDVYVSDVTVTLTATDNTAVDYTKYNLDNAGWLTYSAPVVVSTNGNHTVCFYSVDVAGNTETQKNCSFTIQKEVPSINITFKGGIGVSATIENTGTAELTDLDWTMSLDGAWIFVGKTKSGTIESLAAGDSVTVTDFVLGFGKTGITMQVEAAEATASARVVLFLVIGVQ